MILSYEAIFNEHSIYYKIQLTANCGYLWLGLFNDKYENMKVLLSCIVLGETFIFTAIIFHFVLLPASRLIYYYYRAAPLIYFLSASVIFCVGSW